MRCCTENHVSVVFEHPEPVPDMGGVIFPDLRRDAEVGAAKGCSQFHPFGAPATTPRLRMVAGRTQRKAQRCTSGASAENSDRRFSQILKLEFRPVSRTPRTAISARGVDTSTLTTCSHSSTLRDHQRFNGPSDIGSGRVVAAMTFFCITCRSLSLTAFGEVCRIRDD